MTRFSSARLESISLSLIGPSTFPEASLLIPPRLLGVHQQWENEGDFLSVFSSVHSFVSICVSLNLLHFFWSSVSLCTCFSRSLLSLPRTQLNQIGWISVAAWLNRYQRHNREQKSITSPLSFHQLSLSLFVSVALSSFFHLSALLLAASSSSSLSFECHSTLPSYSNIFLLIKKQIPSLSKTCALPPPFFLESTDVDPSSIHFLHLWCTSPWTAQYFLTDSIWPVKDGGSQGRTGLGSRKWRKDTRRKEEWGIEKDISNSKRHAVFPWQPGFHRNGLAKDAISVKKCQLTLYCTVCTQI